MHVVNQNLRHLNMCHVTGIVENVFQNQIQLRIIYTLQAPHKIFSSNKINGK